MKDTFITTLSKSWRIRKITTGYGYMYVPEQRFCLFFWCSPIFSKGSGYSNEQDAHDRVFYEMLNEESQS